MSIVYGIIFIVSLSALYAGLYYVNHKTPVPSGCEDLKSECNGCSIASCGNHPSKQY